MISYKITEKDAEELLPYAAMTERQLLRANEPSPGLFVAESPYVIERAIAAGYEPVSFLTETSLAGKEETAFLQKYPDTPVFTADWEILAQITGINLTRGALSLMRRKESPPAKVILENKSRIVILEDVMNPTNVGAIFRSAAALGAEAVLLTEGCSDPLYRRAARVSMGTVFQVPWTWVSEGWTDLLHEKDFAITAMALREDSIALDSPILQKEERLAIVLGSEGYGMKESTILACDHTVMIPMMNGVDSLNVAAASAVAFWELCRKTRKPLSGSDDGGLENMFSVRD